ncbi:hypothetical protein FB451DRAFT_1288217 [Mycena latifolia]|nr:hypothetical protein FB451DRAFT_1288217 [Mycena latifolia]
MSPLRISPLLLDLFVAFTVSSLAIFALLRVAGVSFPLLAMLQITAGWTLVVFAAMRSLGWVHRPPIEGVVEEKGDPASTQVFYAEKSREASEMV